MAGWAPYFGRYRITAGFPAVEAGVATSPKSVRYYVQVARLRLDNAIVEVDASDDGDAEQKAIEQARMLPGAEWELQPFDHAAYQPHAEAMIAQDELTDSEVVEMLSAETRRATCF